MKEFTFSTGITVGLRKVSPFLINAALRTIPKPKPPIQEVEVLGVMRMEENPAHPQYEQDLLDWEQQKGDLSTKILLFRGVDVEIDHELLAQVRADAEECGIVLDEKDDRLAYIKYVCMGDNEDINRLIAALMGEGQPTEEAIEEEIATFRG